MFDARSWAERIERDPLSGARRAESRKAFRLDHPEVLRLIRVEMERLEEQLYRDLNEAIPAHVRREMRRNGGAN
jgi:hypothetical protein